MSQATRDHLKDRACRWAADRFTRRNSSQQALTAFAQILYATFKRGRCMLYLSESEKQEIIRYLKADQDLPDKYRFLLFGDKREVELFWNGRTNEVCNIVLPFQTIEQIDEPRAEYLRSDHLDGPIPDARPAGRQSAGVTTGRASPARESSVASIRGRSLPAGSPASRHGRQSKSLGQDAGAGRLPVGSGETLALPARPTGA